MASKFDGLNCSAPGCERKPNTMSLAGPACNMHYLRQYLRGSFELPIRARSRDVICAECKKPFDRGYAINGIRATKPQFCSRACNTAAMAQKAQVNIAKRFWSRVDKRSPEECWLWKGRRHANGYGSFDLGGRPHQASRMAFTLTKGDPGDLHVCHSCDNPPCCNPSHLWLGTPKDNHADMIAKGRQRYNAARGEKCSKSKLTRNDVLYIRASTAPHKALGRQFGVSGTAIAHIRKRKNWAHV